MDEQSYELSCRLVKGAYYQTQVCDIGLQGAKQSEEMLENL